VPYLTSTNDEGTALDIKLSVVIPCYNTARWVESAVLSALDQTLPQIEVIAVDDGSTDDTRHILWRIRHERGDARLRIIEQPNGGVCAARNAGLRACRGKYVGFLDSDDLWHPEKAERHVAVMDADPTIGITFSGLRNIGKITGSVMPRNAEPSLYDQIRGNQLGMPTIVVRRDCFAIAGLWDEELRGPHAEDWELWCRIMHDTGLRVVLIPEILATYRVRWSSATHRFDDYLRGADACVASLRRKMPEIPSHIFSEGHGEHYRHAAWLAATSGHRQQALRYLAIAAYHYFPRSIWRKSGVMARLATAILLPPQIYNAIQSARGKARITSGSIRL